ncbi:MAG: hypothetical protein AAGC68_09025 [Verrucomicrobiota bacterium]
MIEKFHRYEDAAFFVQEKQEMGHVAYIMNESTGFLWGPSTVGEFRVFVSDEPVEGDPAVWMESPPPDGPAAKLLRWLFFAVLAAGILGALFSAILHFPTVLRWTLFAILVAIPVIAGGYWLFRRDFPERPD